MGFDRETDVVIIGGGIVGAAIARELSRYRVGAVLCEKGLDVAVGTTKANSGILHSGVDAPTGTLKANLNIRGLKLYQSLWEELGLDIQFCGSLIIAAKAEDVVHLEILQQRGRQNGVAGELEILSRDRLLEREPNLSPDVQAALWTSAAGILCPYGAALSFARNAIRNGAVVLTGCEVQQILTDHGQVYGVQTSAGIFGCRFVINAAGIQAGAVSRLAGDDSFSIRARKGEYLLFDRAVHRLVNTVLFPTPSKVSKGILVAPTTHGNYFVGPNAQELDDVNDRSTTCEGLAEILRGARKLMPGLPSSGITQFAGLRAVSDSGDFIVRSSDICQGLFHAAGIQSPGLTAAPAIAERITEMLKEAGLKLVPKREFDPVEPRRPRLREMSAVQADGMVQRNSLYGRIICRCEQVSEGEIVDAIHDLCGARTVDAVKRRTRAGMGRCQGGFCTPRVAAILSRELGLPLSAVCKEDPVSQLYYEKYTQSEVHENA